MARSTKTFMVASRAGLPPALVLFAILAAIAWMALLAVSIRAVTAMGPSAARVTFFGDFTHPWRGQFNADFSVFLLLSAAWMVWRSRSRMVGAVCGILAVIFDALFTLPYLVIAAWRAGGSIEAALLGGRLDTSR